MSSHWNKASLDNPAKYTRKTTRVRIVDVVKRSRHHGTELNDLCQVRLDDIVLSNTRRNSDKGSRDCTPCRSGPKERTALRRSESQREANIRRNAMDLMKEREKERQRATLLSRRLGRLSTQAAARNNHALRSLIPAFSTALAYQSAMFIISRTNKSTCSTFSWKSLRLCFYQYYAGNT